MSADTQYNIAGTSNFMLRLTGVLITYSHQIPTGAASKPNRVCGRGRHRFKTR